MAFSDEEFMRQAPTEMRELAGKLLAGCRGLSTQGGLFAALDRAAQWGATAAQLAIASAIIEASARERAAKASHARCDCTVLGCPRCG